VLRDALFERSSASGYLADGIENTPHPGALREMRLRSMRGFDPVSFDIFRPLFREEDL